MLKIWERTQGNFQREGGKGIRPKNVSGEGEEREEARKGVMPEN